MSYTVNNKLPMVGAILILSEQSLCCMRVGHANRRKGGGGPKAARVFLVEGSRGCPTGGAGGETFVRAGQQPRRVSRHAEQSGRGGGSSPRPTGSNGNTRERVKQLLKRLGYPSMVAACVFACFFFCDRLQIAPYVRYHSILL